MRARSASTVVSSRLRGGSFIPRLAFSYQEFVISDFLLMPHVPGVGISGPLWLLADGSAWQMKVYLSGLTDRHDGFVSVQLECVSFGPSSGDGVQANFSVSILGPKQRLLEQPRAKLTVTSPSALSFGDGEGERTTWEIENLIRESELRATYVDADAVTFAVEIEILGQPAVISQSALAPVVGRVPTLADDLAALFREVPKAPGKSVVVENFSDITVVFSGPAGAVKKFRAHRALLAARSPVFRRKLQSPAFNAKLFFNGNTYYLQEADVGVCEALMVFLYTDDIRNDVLANSAHEVLKVAARFQVERLVQIAEDYVGESLTPTTVVAALTLAAGLKLERLKTCCFDFVAQHAQAVRASHTMSALPAATLKELLDCDVFPAGGQLTGSLPQSPAAADRDTVREDKDKGEADETLSPMQRAQLGSKEQQLRGGEGKEDAEDGDSIPPAGPDPVSPLEEVVNRAISGK